MDREDYRRRQIERARQQRYKLECDTARLMDEFRKYDFLDRLSDDTLESLNRELTKIVEGKNE